MKLFWASVGVFAVLKIPAQSPPEVDKSRFTLFNPTARSLMREMSTDRPEQTESAYTVDAGHFQLESDLFSYTRDSENGSTFESFAAVSLNLKLGLLNNVDLQLGVSPYLHDRFHDSNLPSNESTSGFGDIVTRLKINLWGNDSGSLAFAMMPFLPSCLRETMNSATVPWKAVSSCRWRLRSLVVGGWE